VADKETLRGVVPGELPTYHDNLVQDEVHEAVASILAVAAAVDVTDIFLSEVAMLTGEVPAYHDNLQDEVHEAVASILAAVLPSVK
jgi:hypothetical protein